MSLAIFTAEEIDAIQNSSPALQNVKLAEKINDVINAGLNVESFTGSTSATTTLAKTPFSATAIVMFLNGAPTSDFTRVGKVITWSEALEADDIVYAVYQGL